MGSKIKFDLTGERFGRYTVLGYYGRFKSDCKVPASYWTCLCNCGKVNIVRSIMLRRGIARSCGCLSKERLARGKGPNNANWKGGASFNRRHNSKVYKRWRTSVLERDNYVCQKEGCGDRINKVVHHLFSFSRYTDKRLELSNGVTLCVSHHKEFHKIYGRVNFHPLHTSMFLYNIGRSMINA